MQEQDALKVASQERVYRITAADLPLCCPMPKMRIWDSHPRIYLPIEKTGCIACPYCDAMYYLEKEAKHTST